MKKHSGLMFAAAMLISFGFSAFATAQQGQGQQPTFSDRKKAGAFKKLPGPNGHVETEQEYRMRKVKELMQRLQPYIDQGDQAATLARRTLRNMTLDGEINDAEWEEAKEINRDFPPK